MIQYMVVPSHGLHYSYPGQYGACVSITHLPVVFWFVPVIYQSQFPSAPREAHIVSDTGERSITDVTNNAAVAKDLEHQH
jgi:hypothetical protein